MIPIPEYLASNFKLIRSDGTIYDMREKGILVNSFLIDSLTPIHSRETIDGRDGFVDMGTNYDGRTMHTTCEFIAKDVPDFALFRDELFRILDSREAFYLIVDSEPGKRWHVKCDSKFSIAQSYKDGVFSIDFISDSPYAESVGRTDIDPITMDSDKWQSVGAGIAMDDDLIYTYSTNSFRIYNGGDSTVNPRFNELIIKYVGASDGLTIENTTTGDEFNYNESTSASDVLEINGARVLLNGVSSFSKSNRQLITLAPGWNDIQLSGTSGEFQCTFGFRWLHI
jgi:phage-related protein